MANIIKIKRGLSSDINSAILELGELAITTDTNKLYVGSVSGVPQEVVTISQEQVQAMIDQAIEDETTGLLHLQPTSWINRDIASNGTILSTNDNYQHLHDKTELWYRGEPQPYILDLDFTKHTVEDYVDAGIVELTYSTTDGLTYDDQGMHCTDTDLRNGLKLTNPIPVMQNWTIEMTMTLMPFAESGTSLTTVEYNNVMWFSTSTPTGHTHNTNCYAPAIFVNGGTAASSRLGDKIGTDLSVQNVYKMDGIEHTYKVTWDSETETVAYYRDGEKIGQNTWPSTLTTSPGGEFGYVLGAHMGYSSAKNFATQKGHIIKSFLVYETGKKYNISQATMYNPVDRDVTITGAAGYTYKILGYKDNELHYESEIVEDVAPITYSISDLGDGTCDGMNVWFYGDVAQDLEVENIIQDIKVDYVEWYKDTTATLMAKQKTPMRVKTKSNLEYAIANYDETGAFIDKTDWIAGDEIDHSYADGTYANIAVRTKNEEKIFTADMLKDIEVQIIPDDYATVEYVDNAIANIDIPEVDFTGYATEDYVNTQIEAIPDVDLTNYATTSYVDTSIQNIDFPETDLTDYTTKAEVQEMIDVTTGANYDGDLSKYTTKWVAQYIGADGSIYTPSMPADLTTNPDLWVRQNITTGGAIVSDASTSYNASNVMLVNPIADTVTVTIPTGLMYAQVLYNADGSFKSRGSWNSSAGTIVWSAGDGYQNFTIATNGASSLTKEEMLARFTVVKEDGYTNSAISLLVKEVGPMTVTPLTDTVEYAIVKYDNSGAFTVRENWVSGANNTTIYDNSPGYVNIVVRSTTDETVALEDLLDRIQINVPVVEEEYATKEYVDSTFGKVHVGMEAPTDESIYLWIDITEDRIITFTIGSTVLSAEEGMTWQQWVDSDYNTIGAFVNEYSDGNRIEYIDGSNGRYISEYRTPTQKFAYANETIMANYDYDDGYKYPV